MQNMRLHLIAITLLQGLSLGALAEQAENLKVGGDIAVEYGYDSNVVVEELDLSTSLGDSFLRYKLSADADYTFNDAASASGSLSWSDKRFNDASNFDLRTILASLDYKYKYNDITFGIAVRHADAELGGKGFLALSHLSPSVSFFLSKKHFVRLAYTYSDKTLDDNPLRDATGHELGASYYYFQNGLNRYLILGVKRHLADATDPLYDFSAIELSAAYKQRYQLFSRKNQLSVAVDYRERDFDEIINPAINDFREETRSELSLQNETELLQHLMLQLSLSYIDNQSNLNTFDYSETQYGLTASYSF